MRGVGGLRGLVVEVEGWGVGGVGWVVRVRTGVGGLSVGCWRLGVGVLGWGVKRGSSIISY